jgi:hypothetical protein
MPALTRQKITFADMRAAARRCPPTKGLVAK